MGLVSNSPVSDGLLRQGCGPNCLRSLCFGFALLLHADGILAAEAVEDEAELRDLLSLLDNTTDLATRSGMNADFIPGMASILDGDELLLRGARTVWEALSLVPGVAQGLEMTGERQVLSRGVGYSGYTSGNIKLMLDGVSLNSTMQANANALLNLPIEQVERIEVIRGPGASVYGEYAYAGVVNVISRKHERQIHVQAGEGGSGGIGGVWYWEDLDRDLNLSINFVGQQGEGGAWVDRDALYNIGLASYSNAPGRSDEASRFRSLFVNMEWGGTLASLQILNDEYGDYYGAHHYLPPDDDRLATEQRFITGRVSHEILFSDTFRASLRAQTWRHERSSDLFLLPAGFMGMRSALYIEQDYDEARYQVGADLHWDPSEHHHVLLGLEAARAELLDPPADHWEADRHRRILSALVQDQFRATDRIDLTATVRFDDYSDVGGFVSPRLAGVWRIDDHNILKLQYARAFRPPTFHDLEYPAEDPVKSSMVSTYELGYIYTQPCWEARFIAYQSELDRPVTIALGGIGFVNSADTRLRGIELEYEYRIGPDLKLEASASYVDARRLDDDETLEGGTDVLANLAFLWRPFTDWTTAAQLRYVGERVRADYDPRDPLPGYTLVDLSLQYRPSVNGFFGTLGVKNLTDVDYAYPDQSFVGVRHLMPDDYPRPGRTWWLSVGYNF